MSKAKYLKKYQPKTYEQYLRDKVYVVDFKKYKVASVVGKRIVLEEVDK